MSEHLMRARPELVSAADMPNESLLPLGRPIPTDPATHVLVIGVGLYDHLAGGRGPISRHASGTGQLTSPSVSARAVAEWFLSEFDNPNSPLGSVALLLSDPTSRAVQASGQDVEVPEADALNVIQAIREWFDRGNAHPDNLVALYLSGHGISSGSRMAF